jgi:hypothetical protein
VCNKQVKSITDSEKTDDAEQLSSELFIEGLQLKQNWRASNPIKMCAYICTYIPRSELPDGTYSFIHTKNPNVGIFWRVLELKMVVYIFYSYFYI